MSTSLIIRNPSAPSPRVLEIDGPRRRYTQRGEGSYYLSTSNTPPCDDVFLNGFYQGEDPADPRLKEWGEPHWEIYQKNDGSVEVHACRPNESEIYEGDLPGALGSVIKLTSPTEWAVRNGLRLARRLLRADPEDGVVISYRELVGIITIESDLPVRVYTPILDL